MVKLEEVEDDHFAQEQPGPKLENDDDFYTDTDSEISSDDDPLSTPLDETLTDRIFALRDILPPAQRRYLSSTLSTATAWAKSGLLLGGKTLWVVSTSALLLGVPWALAWSEEQQMMEMEKEMKMQQSVNELLTPGATSQLGGQQGRPAL